MATKALVIFLLNLKINYLLLTLLVGRVLMTALLDSQGHMSRRNKAW